MKGHAEPLFTWKGVIGGAVLFAAYAAILFSLDPQWVGWAGPLVFGGALYAADPSPVRAISLPPQETFEMASVYMLASVLALGILLTLRGEPRLGWLPWIWHRLRDFALRQRLAAARAFPSSRSGDGIESIWKRQKSAAGQQSVAGTPRGHRAIPRDLGMGSPEDLPPVC